MISACVKVKGRRQNWPGHHGWPTRQAGWLGCATAALVWIAVAAAPARAHALKPLRWHAPQLVDPRASARVGGLTAVGCASGPFCVAFGATDVVTSTDPSGGSRAWKASRLRLRSPSGPVGAACPSKHLCVAVGADELFTSTDPLAGGASWHALRAQGNLHTVSCLSSHFCAAGGDGAITFVRVGADRGRTSLRTFAVPTSTPEDCGKQGPGYDCQAAISGVSCPTRSLCVAVDNLGDVVTSTRPTQGFSAWRFARVDRSAGFDGVACPTPHLCVAVDYAGDLFRSTRPGAGAMTWERISLPLKAAGSSAPPEVACGSASLCVEVVGGEIAASRRPAGRASTWRVTHVRSEHSLQAISCTAQLFCVAVDRAGRVVVGSR
jgi:hypothetical protein